jgi:hypothetical protein
MSELTKCNYCTLEAIKRSYPGREVTVIRITNGICGLQVFIDGRGIGVWFDELSDHCVC